MSEKRQARFEMLRETSKERIENTAMELFAHNGYGHTSISQIAKVAGISKGLLYNYYDSKEDLLRALLRKGFDFGDKLLEASSQGANNDPIAMLTSIIETSFQELSRHFTYWKLLMSLAFQEDVLKTVAPELDAQKKLHLEMGKTIFSQLGYPHPEMQVLLFGATMDGVFMHFILSPNDYPLATMKQMLLDNFCKQYNS